jgi:hypothetical protein
VETLDTFAFPGFSVFPGFSSLDVNATAGKRWLAMRLDDSRSGVRD